MAPELGPELDPQLQHQPQCSPRPKFTKILTADEEELLRRIHFPFILHASSPNHFFPWVAIPCLMQAACTPNPLSLPTDAVTPTIPQHPIPSPCAELLLHLSTSILLHPPLWSLDVPTLSQRSCRRGRERGAAFTFLPRAHLSAELSAVPVIGPRRSLVLGVNTAESEKTRAELRPGPSHSTQGSGARGGVGGHLAAPPSHPRVPKKSAPEWGVLMLLRGHGIGCSCKGMGVFRGRMGGLEA